MWPNPRETTDLITFTEEILNEKLHFLCSEYSCLLNRTLVNGCFCEPLLNFLDSNNFRNKSALNIEFLCEWLHRQIFSGTNSSSIIDRNFKFSFLIQRTVDIQNHKKHRLIKQQFSRGFSKSNKHNFSQNLKVSGK